MKKYLICIMLVLVFVTGCQSSTEKNNGSVESQEKKNEKNPIATPKLSDSMQVVGYDVHKSGKEMKISVWKMVLIESLHLFQAK